MKDDFCGHALRQVPCSLEEDGGVPGPCEYRPLDDALCDALCWDPADRCGGTAKPCVEVSHIQCAIRGYRDGARALECYDACPGGRRPADHRAVAVRGAAMGRFFGQLAQLETVSIRAFQELGDALERIDAPAELVARARRAKVDEVRHARVTWRLARRFGVEPVRLERPRGPRTATAREIAIENAREGCVREMYGALVASLQAHAAEDAEVRTEMAEIAKDETEHAALAWSLQAHFAATLDARTMREIDDVMNDALHELRLEAALVEREEDVLRSAGLPRRREAIAAVDALAVWIHGARRSSAPPC